MVEQVGCQYGWIEKTSETVCCMVNLSTVRQSVFCVQKKLCVVKKVGVLCGTELDFLYLSCKISCHDQNNSVNI